MKILLTNSTPNTVKYLQVLFINTTDVMTDIVQETFTRFTKKLLT